MVAFPRFFRITVNSKDGHTVHACLECLETAAAAAEGDEEKKEEEEKIRDWQSGEKAQPKE